MLDYRMDTFLMLCKLMNYRKTAEALHISQPAVTQQIHYLENTYHCKLFIYQNRRLVQTEQGRILESYGQSMKYNEEQLRRDLRMIPQKELRIGATKTIGDYVIGDHVCRFLAAEKNRLSLIVDNTRNLLKLLDDDQLDFAIIEGNFDKRRYDSLLYREEPFIGICQKGHPFSGRKVELSDLFSQTIIHREQGSGTRAVLEQILLSHSESLQQFRRQIAISSFPLILQAVRQGIGISFVYKVLADSDQTLGQFTIKGENIVREFNIVFLKHTDISEKLHLFFPDTVLV